MLRVLLAATLLLLSPAAHAQLRPHQSVSLAVDVENFRKYAAEMPSKVMAIAGEVKALFYSQSNLDGLDNELLYNAKILVRPRSGKVATLVVETDPASTSDATRFSVTVLELSPENCTRLASGLRSGPEELSVNGKPLGTDAKAACSVKQIQNYVPKGGDNLKGGNTIRAVFSK